MISLNDIKNYEFKRGIGYSKKSVEEFKTEVISAYDEVCKENIELKDKMTALSEGLQYYKSCRKLWYLHRKLLMRNRRRLKRMQELLKRRLIPGQMRFLRRQSLTLIQYSDKPMI